jgi:hypothetical protein
MKTRHGFVSNSSSTSFVLYIPKDFNPNSEEMIVAINEQIDDKSTKELESSEITDINTGIRLALQKLIDEKSLSYEDCNEDGDLNCSIYEIIQELLEHNVVAELETESDRDQLIVIDNDKLTELQK